MASSQRALTEEAEARVRLGTQNRGVLLSCRPLLLPMTCSVKSHRPPQGHDPVHF